MGDRADADLYGVLGVTRDATAREIRRAYRRLARQEHPDLNAHPDGPQRFVALANAYEILHDPVRRARYDQTLGRSPAPTMPARSAPRPPARPIPADRHAVRRGILELSLSEAVHLARAPLALRDARGRRIVLPTGTDDGDQITVVQDGHVAVLTVRVR